MSLSTDTMLLGLGLLVYDAGFNRWASGVTAAGFGLLVLGYLGSVYTSISDIDE